MVNESRIDIYDYLYNLLFGVVSENVYDMRVPQELTESDTTDGFLVIHVGSFVDESEFHCEAYGRVRCYIEAFIPQISRGRVNHDIYAAMENSINNVIEEQTETDEGAYYIEQDSVLSMDDTEESNSDNAYFTFIKSFIVVTDNQEESPIHFGDLYIGMGGESISSKEDVENLLNVQHYNRGSATGDYQITIPSTSYLWICTTSSVGEVLSNGFQVPMNKFVKVGNLNCYRTTNSIIPSEMNFSIV